MFNVIIRPYEHRDRGAVFRLAADTAFFGEPVEAWLDDRALFCDCLYRYYTDLEPQHSWVACAGGTLAGFLMGSVDTATQHRMWMRNILPQIAIGALRGQYEIGARTWLHAGRLARAVLQTGPRVNLTKHPANLHLNVQSAWRRHQLGRRLLEAYLRQLSVLQIAGVHLNTTNLNVATRRLFESTGFRLAGTRPAPQWSGLVPERVFKLTYVLDLPPQQSSAPR